jgi:tRNA threonylcarbamoyladenosine biosynthesis protein TsaE
MGHMSTGVTWQTESNSLSETEALAAGFGARLRGGEVIELVSDLGGGKTAFVRGLARGMGSQDAVASPSFTISREYASQRLRLYHFDFYRLSDPGIMALELAELVQDEQAVIAVEWAGAVASVLPERRLRIAIEALDDQSRRFSVTGPADMAYLLPEH